jgi:hypothetical protein
MAENERRLVSPVEEQQRALEIAARMGAAGGECPFLAGSALARAWAGESVSGGVNEAPKARAEGPVHYAGRLRLKSDETYAPGWPVCCGGSEANTARREKRQTQNRAKVTCRKCRLMLAQEAK